MLVSELVNKFSKTNEAHTVVSVCEIDTPIGKLYGGADDNFLYIVCFKDSKSVDKCFLTLHDKLTCRYVETKNKVLKQLEEELEAYFKGTLKKFRLPVKTIGSDFQQLVWEKLQEVPYGSTQTYGDVAKALGRETSHSRAVGAACGANLHVVIIPCHRIIASGSKGGYSCGKDRKYWLMEHEQRNALL